MCESWRCSKKASSIISPQVARPNNKEGYKTIIQEEESLGNNWDITMNRLLTNQEERIQKLEEGICTTESTKMRIESLEYEIQNRCQQIRSISNNNEIILPELLNKAQASSVRVRTAEADVDQRLSTLPYYPYMKIEIMTLR